MEKSAYTMDTIVDFSTVDVYPVFENCESLDGEINHEKCFGDELLNQLKNQMQFERVNGPEATYDTIYVDLLVDQQNKIKVTNINSATILHERIPNIDSILISTFERLPLVSQSALKRGIPVKSQFTLPVLIRTHN